MKDRVRVLQRYDALAVGLRGGGAGELPQSAHLGARVKVPEYVRAAISKVGLEALKLPYLPFPDRFFLPPPSLMYVPGSWIIPKRSNLHLSGGHVSQNILLQVTTNGMTLTV